MILGTKINTTKFDCTKIKPVLNLIRLRYILVALKLADYMVQMKNVKNRCEIVDIEEF